MFLFFFFRDVDGDSLFWLDVVKSTDFYLLKLVVSTCFLPKFCPYVDGKHPQDSSDNSWISLNMMRQNAEETSGNYGFNHGFFTIVPIQAYEESRRALKSFDVLMKWWVPWLEDHGGDLLRKWRFMERKMVRSWLNMMKTLLDHIRSTSKIVVHLLI